MQYAYCAKQNGVIYSLDMLNLKVDISTYKLNRLVNEFIDDEEHKISKVAPVNNVERRWKYFISCTYRNGKTIKMGFHMNGVSEENKESGFIEFNPNSFAEIEEFWDDYKILMSYYNFPEIRRFDLAIDLPISRDNIAFIKDQRMYSCYRKSPVDFTETLGKRNTVGRVKLYNKSIESRLSYPLTRLEITGNLDNLNLPQVIDLTELPISDKMLIKAILENDNVTLALADVSQYHRSRILNLIKDNLISFDEDCIADVIQYAKSLAPRKELLK